ncbi:MAG TPA: tetratricopeptide repeat protein, partial [Flavisolibacter sp.]|nr:tetratricopeptide repeat protein [Flavisolibacter sp.]
MKLISGILLVILFNIPTITFSQDQTPQQTARTFMRSGDFDNAIVVLNRALQQDPNNLDMQKDLTLAYYYKRDYAKALDKVKPMLERDDA